MSRESFERFVKPRLVERLRSIRLDVEYVRGEGDTLVYRDERGHEVSVLDMVGGFGAALLGHNHPEIVAASRRVLDERRPFCAQASIRATAGALGERLARRLGAAVGGEWRVTFGSTGAEAVEAALKHAELERRRRADETLARFRQTAHEIRRRLEDGTASLGDELLTLASRALGGSRLETLEELFLAVHHQAAQAFELPPVFVALEGAFHGKTSGSLKLTYKSEYQTPWRALGPRSVFVREGDDESLRRVVAEARVPYFELALDGPRVVLRQRSTTTLGAVFVEPIQGEGGIRVLDPRFARLLREVTLAEGVPLVVDEIQSGMGRTGTFLASEPWGIRGDYYLFSKALGGGLAKIAALVVDRARYVDDFGYLHTSTFADDDHASAVSLACLDVLERNDGEVVRRAGEVGARLIERLEGLAARYPGELVAVRGRGLMIGIELASQDGSRSPLLRVLSEQKLLGYVVSGYMLHEERIRVAPTLSAPTTLRLEPSVFLDEGAVSKFLAALERLLKVLAAGDAYALVRYVVGPELAESPRLPETASAPPQPRRTAAVSRGAARVAFLSHFLEAEDLAAWDLRLAPFGARGSEAFLERTRGMLEPFVVTEDELRSALGTRAHVTVIGLPFTPSQVTAALRAGEASWAHALVLQGIELARRAGCKVVGFGGYTSILTRNCRTVVASDLALTSGNSLTSAAALDALFQAARRRIEGPRRLAVVGAAGNIGAVLAEVAADQVDEIVLVGRPGTEARLAAAARVVLASAFRTALARPDATGLPGHLLRSGALDAARELAFADDDTLGAALLDELAKHERSPVRTATDLGVLRHCNLVISASNAPKPIVLPEHVGRGPVVLADVAAPRDVHPSVLDERPDALVLKGGVVRAPLGQSLHIDGMRLPPGELYGCLAETLLMGLAGLGENLSYGALTGAAVRRVRDLARAHGFVIDEHPFERLENTAS